MTDLDLQGIAKLGGRKFALSVLSVLSATTLVFFGKIDPGVYSVIMVATIGAYIAGNVVQHVNTQPEKPNAS